jgi:hypothetical protein
MGKAHIKRTIIMNLQTQYTQAAKVCYTVGVGG